MKTEGRGREAMQAFEIYRHLLNEMIEERCTNGLYDPKTHMSQVKMEEEITREGGDEPKTKCKSLKRVGKEQTEIANLFSRENRSYLQESGKMVIAREQSRRDNSVIQGSENYRNINLLVGGIFENHPVHLYSKLSEDFSTD